MFLQAGRTLLAPHSSSPRLVWEKEQGAHARFSQLGTSSLWQLIWGTRSYFSLLQTACPQDTHALSVSAVCEGASLWGGEACGCPAVLGMGE